MNKIMLFLLLLLVVMTTVTSCTNKEQTAAAELSVIKSEYPHASIYRRYNADSRNFEFIVISNDTSEIKLVDVGTKRIYEIVLFKKIQ